MEVSLVESRSGRDRKHRCVPMSVLETVRKVKNFEAVGRKVLRCLYSLYDRKNWDAEWLELLPATISWYILSFGTRSRHPIRSCQLRRKEQQRHGPRVRSIVESCSVADVCDDGDAEDGNMMRSRSRGGSCRDTGRISEGLEFAMQTLDQSRSFSNGSSTEDMSSDYYILEPCFGVEVEKFVIIET